MASNTRNSTTAKARQLATLSRCYAGWRWEIEATSLHIWIRVAGDVASKDVQLRVPRSNSRHVALSIRSQTVFDESMRLFSEIEGDDCEWTIEADAFRQGARSVHVTVPVVKSPVEWVECFCTPLPRALRTTKIFGEPMGGDSTMQKKKKKPPRVIETIAGDKDLRPTPRLPKPYFYGVPVCDARGQWAVWTGPKAAKRASDLVARSTIKETAPETRELEFDPFLRLGLALDDTTCEVLSVVPDGQAARLGVGRGWYVGVSR